MNEVVNLHIKKMSLTAIKTANGYKLQGCAHCSEPSDSDCKNLLIMYSSLKK